MHRKTIMILILLFSATGVLATPWIYKVDPNLCNGCGNCIPWCPIGAISMVGSDAWIDPAICNSCGACAPHCPMGAIYKEWVNGIDDAEIPVEITIFPNPTSGCVIITGLDPGQTASLFSLSGRLLVSSVASYSELMMDISVLDTGCYILKAGESPAGLVSLIGR